MEQDLKIIKKKYGENMCKLCRELFPTLLEKEGLLSELLLNNFNPSRLLYDDIIHYNLEGKFKNYIYNLVYAENIEKDKKIKVEKTARELLDEAGYILYECYSEEEIQSFKKYYAPKEELCTFKGERLNRCHVFFAVKKDVDNIRREDFDNPKREDLYGTSVISIQFTKDDSHTLSIKNRYNHGVKNPDSTFSNNLDNIISGLTKSFASEYGLVQKYGKNTFEIPGYVKAKDNKYYKYNYEINNIYYCPDNIIIDNFETKKLEKEKYILFDYFILDLKNKSISLYDKTIEDSFIDTMQHINIVEVKNNKDEKEILIRESDGNRITITLDSANEMIGYANENIKIIGNKFFYFNQKLKQLELPNAEVIRDCFLFKNTELSFIQLPKVEEIGNKFLWENSILKQIELPNVQIIGNEFLYPNRNLTNIELSKAKKIGNYFLINNKSLETIELPVVEEIGDYFLYNNKNIKKIELSKAKKLGNYFLSNNEILEKIELSNIQMVGKNFLSSNPRFRELGIEDLQKGILLNKEESSKKGK